VGSEEYKSSFAAVATIEKEETRSDTTGQSLIVMIDKERVKGGLEGDTR
jgi:hypothetical protein